MEKENKQVLAFDFDQLVGKIYLKIAKWHNNDKKLNDDDKQTELTYISTEIIEEVISTCLGAYQVKMGVIDKGVVSEVKKTVF